MAKYYALITGRGYGCDYTIGCNVQFMELNTATDEPKDIYKQVVKKVIHYFGDDRIESIKVVKVTEEFDFDLAGYAADVRKRKAEGEAKAAKAERLKQFEALKKEFGEG